MIVKNNKVFFTAAALETSNYVGLDGRRAQWLCLYWNDSRFHHYWLLDKRGLRLPNAEGKYAILNRIIEHFAVVKHHCWSSLLVFSNRRMPQFVPSRYPQYPRKIDRHVYSILGSTFDPQTAMTMIQGIKSLELKLLEFTWPEFLEHNQLVQATRPQVSDKIHIAEQVLASAVR